MTRTWTALGLALFLACPGAAGAAEQASALLREGIQQFSEAQFTRSIAILRRARTLPAPPETQARVRLYLGLNEAVLGRGAQARRAFQEALELDPRLTLRAEEIKPAIVAIFDDVRKKLGGTIAVTADRPAEVHVDGKPAGVAPLSWRAAVGPHLVSARTADGCFAGRARLVMPVGGAIEARLTLSLDLDAGPRCAAAPAAPVERRREPPRRRVWAYVTGGAALAALVVGIGVGASSNADYGEYETTGDPRRARDLGGTIAAKDCAANVFYGIGGALAVTSVVLFFLEGRAASERPVTLRIGPGAIGLVGRY